LLLHRPFSNEDSEWSASLHHQALAVDGLRGADLRVAYRAHATVDAAQLEDGSRQITSGSSQDWLVTRILPSRRGTAMRVCPFSREFGSSGPPSRGPKTIPSGLERFPLRSVCPVFTMAFRLYNPFTVSSLLLYWPFTNEDGEGFAPLHHYAAAVDGLKR
jgi:hypothetical protein